MGLAFLFLVLYIDLTNLFALHARSYIRLKSVDTDINNNVFFKLPTPYKKIIQGLQIYLQIYKTIDVPQNFIVPREEPWPEFIQNYRLGQSINRLRSLYARDPTKLDKYFIEQVTHLGFKWSYLDYRFLKLLDALKVYKERYGHLSISAFYQITKDENIGALDDDWNQCKVESVSNMSAHVPQFPLYLHGFKLGNIWQRIMQNDIVFSECEFKVLIDHNIVPADTPRTFDNIMLVKSTNVCRLPPYLHGENIDLALSALHCFYSFYGHTDMPTDYTIDKSGAATTYSLRLHPILLSENELSADGPSKNASVIWPKKFIDLSLGKLIESIQLHPYAHSIPAWQSVYKSITLLKPLSKHAYESFLLDVRAIDIFRDIYHHTVIPTNFIVPTSDGGNENANQQICDVAASKNSSNNIDYFGSATISSRVKWPKDMGGLKLGKNVYKMYKLQRHASPEHHAILKHHNFNPLQSYHDRAFELVLLGLKSHYQYFGDYLVPRYFVVPHDSSWPEEIHGMKLGYRLNCIRAKVAYNKPKYHKTLADIGYIL